MLTHILAYILGIGTGAGVLIVNKRCVDKAVAVERNRSQKNIERIKREHIRIVRERDDLLRELDWKTAYAEGRKSPLSDAERLAEAFEGKKARIVNTSA